jgi:N-acetylglucosaminyl-diphospho-decaprenol L-rhamnosyltransferase
VSASGGAPGSSPAGESATPMLSIVILSWNTRDLTIACLQALAEDERTARHAREVIVIDNASGDDSADAIAAFEGLPSLRLVRNAENVGYAGGHNQGALLARGRFLCTLNSDTEVRPGALDLLVDWLEQHPDYGAAAPRLVYPDGRTQTACMAFPRLATAVVYDNMLSRRGLGKWIDDRYHMRHFDHLHSRDVEQPPGTCTVMDRQEFLDLGGFDEDLWLFFNDVDLCRRMWSDGRRIRYVAEAEVLHHEGASTKSFGKFVVMWHRNRLQYYRKHYGLLGGLVVRFAVRLRAWEERRRIRKITAGDPAAQKAGLADLDRTVREIFA